MSEKTRYVIEIPARMGSKRVKQKNLRLIDGKPMIQYAIEAAKESRVEDIYVNTESEILGGLARDLGVKFFKRDAALAQDTITSDAFNYDFIKKVEPDVLIMVNPVSPLISGADIDAAIDFFEAGDYDSVITVRKEHLQAFCEDKAINFEPDGPLPMTQNIPPVVLCAWSVCLWRAATFVRSFESKGYALFSGKVGFFPMDSLKCIKVSTEDDFHLVDFLIRSRKEGAPSPEYFSF